MDYYVHRRKKIIFAFRVYAFRADSFLNQKRNKEKSSRAVDARFDVVILSAIYLKKNFVFYSVFCIRIIPNRNTFDELYKF